MTLSRPAFAFLIALLLPFLAFAQQEDELRAAIHADIMSDPRSSEMSPTEINAMVEALATQAEEEGVAEQYLEAQNSFEPEPVPVYEPESAQWDALRLALLALAVVLVGAVSFLIWHRKKLRGVSAS